MIRVVVIARTIAEGRQRQTPGFANVAIVTPRAPHRARGITADMIDIDGDMLDHPELDRLIRGVQPCVSASRTTALAPVRASDCCPGGRECPPSCPAHQSAMATDVARSRGRRGE